MMWSKWLPFFVLQILTHSCSSVSVRSLDMPCATASWSSEGKTVIGGTQGNDSNQLSHPYGLFMDSNNTLFIADSGNNRVMKLDEGVLLQLDLSRVN
jgi:hypothetical protein